MRDLRAVCGSVAGFFRPSRHSSSNNSTCLLRDRRSSLASSFNRDFSPSGTLIYPEEPDGLLMLDPQLICYSWITSVSEVAQVVFVRKRLVEIQYFRTTINDEQRNEFGQLVEDTVRRIELSSCRTAVCGFPKTLARRAPMSACAWADRIWSTLPSSGVGEKTLVGLTSLRTSNPPMLPKLNKKRALFVLTKIDEILAWEKRSETERDTRFVELGRYLCEVRAGQYWRLENLGSFDEFLERRCPESRRKAYYLMSIQEHLPPQVRRELKQVGWSKGLELAKVARRDGQHFDCANWLHRAREMPYEQFRRAVEKELTGKEEEPSELIYFKVYKRQVPVIEQALETGALMLGTDKSRGYCLEMICADFLAGANLENGNSEVLLQSTIRFFSFLPDQQREVFFEQVNGKTS